MLRLLRNPVVKRPIYLALIQHSPKLFDHVTFFPPAVTLIDIPWNYYYSLKHTLEMLIQFNEHILKMKKLRPRAGK